MTEDQAKLKWCPMLADTGGHRPAGGQENRDNLCIGSGCMAWRWHMGEMQMSHDADGVLFRPYKEEDPIGFCGLAGKP